MKKVFTIVFVAVAMVACQKEDIRPNTGMDAIECSDRVHPSIQQVSFSQPGTDESGTPGYSSGGTTPVTDFITGSKNDSIISGTITDPLRKKDERDRKGKP